MTQVSVPTLKSLAAAVDQCTSMKSCTVYLAGTVTDQQRGEISQIKQPKLVIHVPAAPATSRCVIL